MHRNKQMNRPREQELFALFEQNHINYETVEHEPLFTVSQSEYVSALITGAHTKNLFLKDDSKKLWLISALQDTQINLKELGKCLPAKGLRFAQAELLQEYLGVQPGSVTWFALINDPENKVNALLDARIFSYDKVAFHPLRNTATTVISCDDLIKFTQAIKHTYHVMDL